MNDELLDADGFSTIDRDPSRLKSGPEFVGAAKAVNMGNLCLFGYIFRPVPSGRSHSRDIRYSVDHASSLIISLDYS